MFVGITEARRWYTTREETYRQMMLQVSGLWWSNAGMDYGVRAHNGSDETLESVFLTWLTPSDTPDVTAEAYTEFARITGQTIPLGYTVAMSPLDRVAPKAVMDITVGREASAVHGFWVVVPSQRRTLRKASVYMVKATKAGKPPSP